ncbi:hypothetical protein Desor_4767 [Desulfosporosinus orientis DSM 765]|uniref:Uncharacterized protein n=1 Tax=Desulfosporosinus orientis (strain ATCC 19365 / DSM 765 / NCIMB 8382 / VKM B-1628 / Singapore I) TaxID=768706 RepID=G7WG76_DESOD|nr:hypothetical protein Desor_4767 [Desulfosporosinus orientis DSM 765]
MQIFKYEQKEIEYLKSRDKRLGAAIDKIGMIKREIIGIKKSIHAMVLLHHCIFGRFLFEHITDK